jgi:hypothetical protein
MLVRAHLRSAAEIFKRADLFIQAIGVGAGREGRDGNEREA